MTDPKELRDHLQSLLTGGAARNAIDCAHWEFEAKQNDQLFPNSLFELPEQMVTALTVSMAHQKRWQYKLEIMWRMVRNF